VRTVGPDTNGALWIGCARARFSLLPWRWPALFLDLAIRAFRLLRQPWLGRYSHLFLWHNTTIWEASTIWRRGNIREYDRHDLIVDAMEVRNPAGGPLPARRVRRLCCFADALVGQQLGPDVVTVGLGDPALGDQWGRAKQARDEVSPLQPWQVRKATEMAEAMVGRPYDWYQIIRIAAFELGIIHDDRMSPRDGDRPICSEGVAMCYLAAGIDLPGAAGVPLWRFAPDHMDKLRRQRPDLVRLVGRLSFGEKGEAS